LRQGRDDQHADADSRSLSQTMPDYLRLPEEDFDAEAAWLMTAYLAPFVRLECASIVSKFASASMDLSDGLVADAAKLAAASGVALRIEINAVPFSIPAERWAFTGGDVRKLITGGDDYVVMFTASPELRGAIEAAEGSRALRLARIGVVEAGRGVSIVNLNGEALDIPEAGYSHKLGK
jgi:thiamine-monophosphate kinase